MNRRTFTRRLLDDKRRSLFPHVLTCQPMEDGAVALVEQSGAILTLAEFEELAAQVYAFFDDTDAETIEEHNADQRQSGRPAPTPHEPKQPRLRIAQGGTIYAALAETGGVKIGKTSQIDVRLRTLRTMSPVPLVQVHTIQVSDMEWAEKYLHLRFAQRRSHGEWFRLTAAELDWLWSLKTLEPS